MLPEPLEHGCILYQGQQCEEGISSFYYLSLCLLSSCFFVSRESERENRNGCSQVKVNCTQDA